MQLFLFFLPHPLLPVRDLYLSTGGKFHRSGFRVHDIQPDYNAANQRKGQNRGLLSGLLQHIKWSPSGRKW